MMALLHVIDRPQNAGSNPGGRYGFGAVLSAASHLVLAASVIVLVRSGQAQRLADAAAQFDAQRLVWLPNFSDGGGRAGGGDRSIQPARAAKRPGTDSASIPATPPPSSATLADTPIEPLEIVARPTGDSHQALPGPIASESTADVLGRNSGSGGDADGPSRGQGHGPRGFGDGLKTGSPGVTTPVVIQQVKPQYTADAMRAKIQGAVWLECIVLADGSVGDVRVTRSLDSRLGLDEEAIAAAKRWRFKPGLMNGQPVAVAVTIELTFTLR